MVIIRLYHIWVFSFFSLKLTIFNYLTSEIEKKHFIEKSLREEAQEEVRLQEQKEKADMIDHFVKMKTTMKNEIER